MTQETQHTQSGDRWLTVKQYMNIMPVSRPHVYRMIKENKIPHTRVGRKVLIHFDAVRPLRQHIVYDELPDETYRRRLGMADRERWTEDGRSGYVENVTDQVLPGDDIGYIENKSVEG